MNPPPSLRGLYHDPSSTWSFSSPQPLAPPEASVASSPASHSYQWTPTRNNNSIFDLSPSLADGSEPLNATLVFRSLVASALLQYTSTAIAMPWEVGKLLLQVQWIPRHDSQKPASEASREEDREDEEDEEVMSESSNDDSYFADPAAASASRRYPAARLTDEQGYVIRQRLSDEGTRPAYIIPIGSADGVWGMIKRVRRFPAEGWLSLWKGLLTSSVTELAFTTMQPILQACLHSVFMPSSLEQTSIFLPVASHVIAGFILSPLDLIRTRLIAQSFSPRHRTYSGPFDALMKILREEGGFKGLYLHPHLFIPTMIDCALKPLIALSMPGLLGRYLGLHEDTSHPLVWGLGEMVGGCVGLLVTLPIETARRRLQIQTRGTAKRVKTCVETRPTPYNGVADCLWQVVAEERSDFGKDKNRVGKSLLGDSGIGQLYRGMGVRLGASALVFLLQLFTGSEEIDSGWAEL